MSKLHKPLQEFLDEDNVCGRSLLGLVARGSAIITELYRLADHIPPIFKSSDELLTDLKDNNSNLKELSSNNSTTNSSSTILNYNKYQQLLYDFRYLKSPELYDEKIDSNVELADLDEEFRDVHMAILERFWKLFESIYRYITDFNSFVDDVNEGIFVSHTVESILEDTDGKQLMAEAAYLFGAMLLLLDRKIHGQFKPSLPFYQFRGSSDQFILTICLISLIFLLNFPQARFERR
jgi:WASH complex subunit strumpellin